MAYETEADKVARVNGWNNPMACGYLDGKRDRALGRVSPIPRTEATDYAHGYWKGYNVDPERSGEAGEGKA